MASYVQIVRKNTRPYMQSLGDDLKARRNPHFFWPSGTQVYCGTQGSGKTISVVKHVHDLKKRYPMAILVSNLNLTNFKAYDLTTQDDINKVMEARKRLNWAKMYLRFSSMEELQRALVGINNEKYGVIYLIDEIHTYFNALDSKNIPMYVFTEISQQRKQRKLILGTSQLFLRMAKPFREQCDNMVVCRTIFGFFSIQHAYDGMTLEQDYQGKLIGKVKKRGWFFHTRKIRNSFDTYQKVVSGAEQYETQNRVQLVGKKNKPIEIK